MPVKKTRKITKTIAAVLNKARKEGAELLSPAPARGTRRTTVAASRTVSYRTASKAAAKTTPAKTPSKTAAKPLKAAPAKPGAAKASRGRTPASAGAARKAPARRSTKRK